MFAKAAEGTNMDCGKLSFTVILN